MFFDINNLDLLMVGGAVLAYATGAAVWIYFAVINADFDR
jgi:hypothetical protein